MNPQESSLSERPTKESGVNPSQNQWLELTVQGMNCSSCAESIRSTLTHAGASAVWVDLPSQKVYVLPGKPDIRPEVFVQEVEKLGYRVVRHSAGWWERNRERVYLGISMLFSLPFVVDMLITGWHLPVWVQAILGGGVLLVGFLRLGAGAWRSLRQGKPSMETLILLGASAAFGYSIVVWGMGWMVTHGVYFETTALIVTLVLLGFWLEQKALARSESAMLTLIRQMNAPVRVVLPSGKIIQKSSFEVLPGERIVLTQGDTIPVDARVISGKAEVDESIITGEAEPVVRAQGDLLIAGSRVISGSVKAEVETSGEATSLAQIIQTLDRLRKEKGNVRRLADTISAIFVPTVVSLSIAVFLGWWLAGGLTPGEALMRAIAVLVIACPCAFGIATPLALSAGAYIATRHRIFFKNSASIERIRKIRKVFIDKTGTITETHMSIRTLHSSIPEEEFRALVKGLELFSRHPIAQTILAEWKEVRARPYQQVEEIPGEGVKGVLPDGTVVVARRPRPEEPAHTVVVEMNGKIVGWIDMEEKLKPGIEKLIHWLQQVKNLEVAMLTGDTRQRAEEMARRLQIQEIYSECTPEDKMRIIARAEEKHPVAMVGDGLNDAPALTRASLSFSLGTATEVARNAASVVVVSNTPADIIKAWKIGERTYRTIVENFFWAMSYNLVAIPIAAMGFLSPSVAALSMAFSDVLLILNTSRLYLWARKHLS